MKAEDSKKENHPLFFPITLAMIVVSVAFIVYLGFYLEKYPTLISILMASFCLVLVPLFLELRVLLRERREDEEG